MKNAEISRHGRVLILCKDGNKLICFLQLR